MQIPVNKNIDDYKDDFFKGLTLKQTVTSVVSVVVGACVFLAFYTGMRVSQSAALYLTLPVVFPIAASGFLKMDGMSPITWMKRRKTVKKKPIYFFHPFIPEPEIKNDSHSLTAGKKRNRRAEKIYLMAGGEEEEEWQ